ncbi:MAG: glycerophosphodiester phosphodiesterase family protein [Myxococcales bacterium]|nr:glycerophosphodiester phosphodiesterase family protein [Myxococcales bacterium]
MDARDAWRSAEGPLLYAHRGARLEHPESTLPALSAALSLGADALEIDAHMTRDGHVVVAHDPDAARMAGVAGLIREVDLATARTWDMGRGFRGRAEGAPPVRMPTLLEVIEALPGARLNVDLKQAEPSMAAATVGCVHEAGAEQRVLLTSFSGETLAAVRAAGYRGPTGLAQPDAFRAFFAPRAVLRAFPLAGGRLQVPVAYGPISLDSRRLLDKMHGLDVAVDYWVINDVDEAARLLDLGADGIVSDDPRAMAGLFARHPATGGWRARHPELARELGVGGER